jgi:hypothetical protein
LDIVVEIQSIALEGMVLLFVRGSWAAPRSKVSFSVIETVRLAGWMGGRE